MTGPRYCLVAVALVGVLAVGRGRCAENVPPARTAGDCGGPGKTCTVDLLAAATTTAAVAPTTVTAASKTTAATAAAASKTTASPAAATAASKTTGASKTTRTTTPRTAAAAPKIAAAGNASDRVAVTVRYDVSGLDAADGDRGAVLREIVSVDETFRRDAAAAAASENAGDAARRTADDVRNATAAPKPISPTADRAKTANAVANNTNVVTANSTVTSVVVTTTSTTTTTTTINVRANVVRNDAQVVRYVSDKYCYCDLIYGSCDIDCCCDTDCTNHDLKSFTSCSDHAESSSSIKPESILFDSSLFYVVVENVPSDYFYPERDAIASESQVAASLRNRDVFAWQPGEKTGRQPGAPPPHRTDPAYNSYDLTHKSVRWMFIAGADGDNGFSDVRTFGLKDRAFDSLCAVEQPVEYLAAKETHCQTFVSNLTDACNNGSTLSFESYFGHKGVFKVLQPVYSGSQKTEKFNLVAIRATAHHRCLSADGSPYDCHVPPPKRDRTPGPPPAPPQQQQQHYHPVYSGGACRRVVDAVEYRLRHNGTGGVRSVDVHFSHRDVTDAGRAVYVSQTFSARFDRVTAAAAAGGTGPGEPYERSGKPGYATGRPVLVAAATTGRPSRPRPMGLPVPDGRGRCVGEPGAAAAQRRGRRTTVNFAEAADVRCRVRVRVRAHRRTPGQWSKRADEPAADVCRGVQNETVAALGDYEGTLVASLGDPDVSRWTPAVVVKPPAQPPSADDPSTCPAVIDGVHIRVLYAYVGTLDRPRATVLGVLVNYTTTAVTVTAETARGRRDDDSSNSSDSNSNGSNSSNSNGANSSDSNGDTFVVVEIPIRATVVFVDLTRPPVRTFAEPPTYEFRLPEDFYYPFWSSSDGGGGGSRPPDPARPSRSSSAAAANPSRPKTEPVLFLSFAAVVFARTR